MRILMFGWEYPPYAAGGLATATLALVDGLTRRGHEVTLVVPFPAAPDASGARVLSASEVSPLLRTVRVASSLTPYADAETYAPWAHRAGPTAYRASLFGDVDAFAAVAAEVAAHYSHDVIHVHDWMTYAAGLAARAVSGRPLVAHIHATERDRSGDWRNPEITRREREGLQAADRIIANSHVTKRRVQADYGVRGAVDVVHWGIAPGGTGEREVSPFGANVPVIAFVGRVVMQKGPEYFIEAAAKVAARHPDVCFVMAGTGDMLPRMLERCVALDIANRVFFTGGLSRSETERVYRIADVVVMPSVAEPFGLVALESLRAGTPVIASRTSGITEVVANLLTVDFWDASDIADKMLAAITDPTLLAELRDRAREELADLRRGPDEPARLTSESYAAAVRAARGS